MPKIPKTNKKYFDFLIDAQYEYTMKKDINIANLQAKHQVSDKFIIAMFSNNIIINVGTIQKPVIHWKNKVKIDNDIIVKLRLWITNNKS